MNRKTILAYSVGVILCLLILFWSMKIWEGDLKVPFSYDGDALPNYACVKGIVDNGWYIRNDFIGMPTGLKMYDYPQSQNLDFILMKLISFFAKDPVLTVNIYYLLTFPLSTLTSIFVLRQFGVSYVLSIFGSLLFAFLPFHFLRFVNHLYYSSYFMIPLVTMVALWIYSQNVRLLFSGNSESGRVRLNTFNSPSIASFIICILVSLTVIYYPFFACFFFFVVGITASLSKKSRYPSLVSVVFILLIVAGVLVNLSPTLINRFLLGENPNAIIRSSTEAEAYGLKIVHLFLPVLGHRSSFLANITNKYASAAPLVNENIMSSLGFVGSLGFLSLIVWCLFRNSTPSLKVNGIHRELDGLCILNLSAVLLATIGGFGSIIAFVVSAQIRAYNRISIYIAFFSLFALVLLLQEFSQRCIKTKKARLIFFGFLGLILFMGIMDQVPKQAHIPWYATIRGYTATKSEYLSDANFVKSIEKSVPSRAMIFQLPYMPFPESPPINQMKDYDHFRAYLHSKTLRWSYGTMRGRDGDVWQREVASKPLEEMVEILAFSGFNGIYIDRYGYADSGAELEEKLSNLLGTEPLISINQRLIFFSTTSFNQKLRALFTDEEWRLKRRAALPLSVQ